MFWNNVFLGFRANWATTEGFKSREVEDNTISALWRNAFPR